MSLKSFLLIYSRNLLQQKVYVDQRILLLEEIFVIFECYIHDKDPVLHSAFQIAKDLQ